MLLQILAVVTRPAKSQYKHSERHRMGTSSTVMIMQNQAELVLDLLHCHTNNTNLAEHPASALRIAKRGSMLRCV